MNERILVILWRLAYGKLELRLNDMTANYIGMKRDHLPMRAYVSRTNFEFLRAMGFIERSGVHQGRRVPGREYWKLSKKGRDALAGRGAIP